MPKGRGFLANFGKEDSNIWDTLHQLRSVSLLSCPQQPRLKQAPEMYYSVATCLVPVNFTNYSCLCEFPRLNCHYEV